MKEIRLNLNLVKSGWPLPIRGYPEDGQEFGFLNFVHSHRCLEIQNFLRLNAREVNWYDSQPLLHLDKGSSTE
jgi:hypothetical protein